MKQAHENLEKSTIKNFYFIKKIGEGNFSQVYQVLDLQKNQNVAAKVIPREKLKSPKLIQLIKTEIRVLKECKNQNVVGFVDSFVTSKSIIIIMELCDGGQLQSYLDKKGRLTEDEATQFLKQIVNGFKGLHEVNAMHRDFKAANILLKKQQCKIADLGFAKQLDTEESVTQTILGTGFIMAPEVHQQRAYGRKADIWSVGVVYYQLIFGKYPFVAFPNGAILKKIKSEKPSFEGVNISEKAKDFISRCLIADPNNRISWTQVYNHPLIKQEQKIRYGMTSSIRLRQNQQFYQQESSNIDIFKQKNEEIRQEQFVKQKQNIQKQLEQAQLKKNLDKIIQNYEKIYLNHRNQIFFMFKYITPFIFDLYKKVFANHSISLFLISKRAYHQMKDLINNMKQHKNVFGLGQAWNQFAQSKQYKSIEEMLESDIFIIELQTHEYINSLPAQLNKQTTDQKNMYVIASKNYDEFLLKEIEGYEFELINSLDKVEGKTKNNLINVIESIYYYRTRSKDAHIEQFDKYLQNLKYEEVAVELDKRLFQRLSSCQQ